MPQMNTISGTVTRARSEGYPITDYMLRRWVRKGDVPSVRAGQKYLIYYPNLLAFLQGGQQIEDGSDKEYGTIRKIEA